jgi:hypothetical protein
MAPLAFAETSNYQGQTAASEEAYLAFPGHNLLRGLGWGSALFAITLFGMLLAIVRLRHAPHPQRRALALLLLASLCMAGGLLALAPLPWQRYVVPLAPFACLWVAYASGSVCTSLLSHINRPTRGEATHE